MEAIRKDAACEAVRSGDVRASARSGDSQPSDANGGPGAVRGSVRSKDAQAAHDAITLENVAFSYGKEPFIEDLSAAFATNAVTSIVGPNGCGKSTLVKLVDGINRPSHGRVLIGGAPTLSMSGKGRARKVAVLAQASRPPAMSVEALVACGRYPYQTHSGRLDDLDREHVERAMELAGVERFRDHDLRRLSGGERQRAFIAMTLAQDTGIIVLDEPTTYLDIGACHETMELVRRLNAEMGKTVVMVIHDLDLALRYSDELMVMERGRRAFSGSVEAVLESGAIERAFGVHIHPVVCGHGMSYSLYPA